MKVFKFGGASVKDADAVRNVARVMKLFPEENIAVVISAMGKTTNALEGLTRSYFSQDGEAFNHLEKVKAFHDNILKDLFPDTKHPVYTEVNNAFVEIEWAIEDEPTGSYSYEYDQIVSVGEMISTRIVSAYLNDQGLVNKWVDVRDVIKTDNNYREGKVDWELTQKLAERMWKPHFEKEERGVIITQGFIGVTSENFSTTLGREGSDYSAAILAFTLGAEDVTIWKDVPGVLNADPKWFDGTVKLNEISYREAIELAYYGATVIHPKTIKPLQNKRIPLYVRSFLNPEEEGTKINENTSEDSLIPSFIFKVDQVLVSISPKDFSFVDEENLGSIFALFAEHKVKVNTMQNSAINFSVVMDAQPERFPNLLKSLQESFQVKYNENLELVTIRHYDQATIDRVSEGKKKLLEQRTRNTVRILMQNA